MALDDETIVLLRLVRRVFDILHTMQPPPTESPSEPVTEPNTENSERNETLSANPASSDEPPLNETGQHPPSLVRSGTLRSLSPDRVYITGHDGSRHILQTRVLDVSGYVPGRVSRRSPSPPRFNPATSTSMYSNYEPGPLYPLNNNIQSGPSYTPNNNIQTGPSYTPAPGNHLPSSPDPIAITSSQDTLQTRVLVVGPHRSGQSPGCISRRSPSPPRFSRADHRRLDDPRYAGWSMADAQAMLRGERRGTPQ